MNRKGLDLLKQLKKYDVIGFDLDNTLARYKLNPFYPMIYDAQVDYLVNNKGWSKSTLDRYCSHQNFMMKGILFDMQRGNLLKLNQDGKISVATHGTQQLTDGEISCQYPDNQAEYFGSLQKKYNSTSSYRIFENAFDLPSSILCALMVDDYDAQCKVTDRSDSIGYEEIWRDVLSSLHFIFNHKNFELEINSYFPNVKKDPDRYIDKVDPDVVELLQELKKEGKVLFILTSSYFDYSEFVLNYIFDSCDWNDIFELVLYFARKPTFFVDYHPFYIVRNNELGEECQTLSPGKYSHGNYRTLHEYLQKRLKSDNPRVVYFGDSVRSDIFPVGKFTDWQPWCVIEEGTDGNESYADTSKRLKNSSCYALPYGSPWGSLYSCGEASDTLWFSMIRNYSPHPPIQQLTDLKL